MSIIKAQDHFGKRQEQSPRSSVVMVAAFFLIGILLAQIATAKETSPGPDPQASTTKASDASNAPNPNSGQTSIPDSSCQKSCFEISNANFSIKEASKEQLDCCSARFAKQCMKETCPGEVANFIPKCNTTWTEKWCEALPDRSWLARNSWIWLVLVAVLIAIVVVVAIVCVYRKKFRGKNAHKKDKRAHLGLGTHMNVDSEVQESGGRHKGHKKHKKASDKRNSTRTAAGPTRAGTGETGGKVQQPTRAATLDTASKVKQPRQTSWQSGKRTGAAPSHRISQSAMAKAVS